MEPQKMSPKDKFDACMKLTEFYTQKAYNRQSHQFKVTIGLWTVLLAIAAFLLDKHVAPPIPKWFGWAVLFAYVFIWVRAIAFKNYKDQRAAFHFTAQAEAVLLDDSHTTVKLPELAPTVRRLRWCFQFTIVWAHQFEVVATALILFALNRILYPSASGARFPWW